MALRRHPPTLKRKTVNVHYCRDDRVPRCARQLFPSSLVLEERVAELEREVRLLREDNARLENVLANAMEQLSARSMSSDSDDDESVVLLSWWRCYDCVRKDPDASFEEKASAMQSGGQRTCVECGTEHMC